MVIYAAPVIARKRVLRDRTLYMCVRVHRNADSLGRRFPTYVGVTRALRGARNFCSHEGGLSKAKIIRTRPARRYHLSLQNTGSPSPRFVFPPEIPALRRSPRHAMCVDSIINWLSFLCCCRGHLPRRSRIRVRVLTTTHVAPEAVAHLDPSASKRQLAWTHRILVSSILLL